MCFWCVCVRSLKCWCCYPKIYNPFKGTGFNEKIFKFNFQLLKVPPEFQKINLFYNVHKKKRKICSSVTECVLYVFYLIFYWIKSNLTENNLGFWIIFYQMYILVLIKFSCIWICFVCLFSEIFRFFRICKKVI